MLLSHTCSYLWWSVRPVNESTGVKNCIGDILKSLNIFRLDIPAHQPLSPSLPHFNVLEDLQFSAQYHYLQQVRRSRRDREEITRETTYKKSSEEHACEENTCQKISNGAHKAAKRSELPARECGKFGE
jgi:hypothetical protein